MASNKPTPQDRHAVSPATGVRVDPPDDIHKDSIFNSAAPMISEIEHLDQSMLSTIMESANVAHLEKRITLLARLIIEHTLWNTEGLSKKERADIALNAIRTFEGTKSTLWVQDPNDKNIPKSDQAMQREKVKIEARLERLLKSRTRLSKVGAKDAADATKIVEMEGRK